MGPFMGPLLELVDNRLFIVCQTVDNLLINMTLINRLLKALKGPFKGLYWPAILGHPYNEKGPCGAF